LLLGWYGVARGKFLVSAVLAVERASKVFRTGEAVVHALRDASLAINSGELIGMFGPSGSGKTTFLLIAGLLDAPTSGRVIFKGQAISDPNADVDHLRDFRRQHIGFVFQKPNLIPFLSAEDNVRVALKVNGIDSTIAAERARSLLEQFGVGARAKHLPVHLSGGEQQRVAIARALANRPELILADEPTANLDSLRGRQVMETFRELADYERVSICVVTHDARNEDLFDRRVEIVDGCIVPTSLAGH
jgi:putative ABC transport system ATP-binding protein